MSTTTINNDSDWLAATEYAWPSGPYIPHEPELPQDAFLWYQGLEALYGGAAGGGKAVELCTPIPTPDGWTTMGELKKGDELFDEYGNVIQVVQAHAINPEPESYRITFDDGSNIDACADHRWLTYNAKELSQLSRRTPEFRAKRRESRESRATGSRGPVVTQTLTARNRLQTPPCLDPPSGAIRTTKEIYDTLFTKSGRANHAIRVAGPVELGKADLPMDPYLLGLWLGDGATSNYVFTSADPELVQVFDDAGYEIRETKRKYTHCVLGIRKELRRAGVFGNKHVPTIYLRASRGQRLALLQGLMDSDGTCNKNGSVSFGNMNPQLAESVAELARSLGSKCTVRTREAKLNCKNCGTAYVVKWSPDYPVFRLQRKLERQKLERRRTTKFHYIVGCEKIESVPMRCITVSSPSGLFLAGKSMIPTHNSDALLMAALQYVDVPGYAALLMRKTYTELTLENALLDRSMKWLGHTDASWNGENRRWTFPSGATLTFGFLQKTQDRARYQSAEFQFIGVDELTAFLESDYRFMFSRLRKVSACGACSLKNRDDPENCPAPQPVWQDGVLRCDQCGNEAPLASMVPIRMRAATNPGGPGHDWVFARFIKPWMDMRRGVRPPNPNRMFVPAKLSDNPHIEQESYRQALHQLEPELAEQLLEGNWDVRPPGFWMMKDPRWIAACVQLGKQMWEEHLSGKNPLPPPRIEFHGKVVDGLGNCIDWGEHTQGYIIWPLPHGGIFIPPSEVVKTNDDPVQATKAFLESAMRFEYPLVIAYYDAAGVQSMRTYRGIVRRIPRFAYMWTRGISFKEYKKETIGYLRVLARRTYDGETERILAIHPANKELIRQLKNWQRKDEESDDALKKDDHGPDALVAGTASTAREYRHFIEDQMRDIMSDDVEPYEVGAQEEGGVVYERS